MSAGALTGIVVDTQDGWKARTAIIGVIARVGIAALALLCGQLFRLFAAVVGIPVQGRLLRGQLCA